MADDILLREFAPFARVTTINGVVAKHQVMTWVNGEFIAITYAAHGRVAGMD